MPMKKHIVFGVHVTDRLRHVDSVQHLLSEYGCNIKTRLGLHEVSEKFCSPNGLLILEMAGDEKKSMELADKLAAVEGIEVQKMIFDHP
jgi:hypothetical protein